MRARTSWVIERLLLAALGTLCATACTSTETGNPPAQPDTEDPDVPATSAGDEPHAAMSVVAEFRRLRVDDDTPMPLAIRARVAHLRMFEHDVDVARRELLNAQQMFHA